MIAAPLPIFAQKGLLQIPQFLSRNVCMTLSQVCQEFLIQGITQDGKTFRPSDWSERLAGAMSSFRPDAMEGGKASFIGYSPYCVPRIVNGVKCVFVSERLRELEPMAWDFVMQFARENQLQVTPINLQGEVADKSA